LVIAAVVAAFAAAALFAGGSAPQQRAAVGAADGGSGIRLVARLARRPAWLIGLVLSAGAFSMHAVTLRFGNLAVVQPVIVSGIVFAVLLRAGLDRRLPPAERLSGRSSPVRDWPFSSLSCRRCRTIRRSPKTVRSSSAWWSSEWL